MRVSRNGGIQNGRFLMEKNIKVDDSGVPLFQQTTV